MNIPSATLAKLNGSHPEGTRHQAKIDIAMSMLGNGVSAPAVLAELRSKFPNAGEKECVGVVNWCQSRAPQPTVYAHPRPIAVPLRRAPAPAQASSEDSVKMLTDGVSATEEEWRSVSPARIPEDPSQHAALLIESLYGDGECLCMVFKHGIKEDGRTFPVGGGRTGSREQWLDFLATKPCPEGEAGTWWRVNPVKKDGSGKDGAHTDADVTACRYALVEHDKLPIESQLAVLSRFRQYGLPIAAVIRTGGKSIHAWVKLDAKDREDYAEKIDQLLSVTQPLGFDHNRNPSRLARIPGVRRKLGSAGDGWQRLIYLNPDPGSFDFEKFKAGFPIPGVVRGDELIERVREWMKPRRAAFTMDFLGGRTPEEGLYFRPSEVTLWTGVSGHGKSSLLKQCMMELICCKIHFFVCSLEHKAEDVCEGMARASYRKQPTSDEVIRFLQKLGSTFHFYDVVGEVAASELLDRMRRSHKQSGATHFFIDSLMRVSGLEEDYPAQTEFMNELQNFAKESQAHIHLVTHPRKIDETQRARKMDVKGSNNIPNNADNILSIRRNVQKEEGKTDTWDAEISVEKQRATGWQGVVKLSFDPASRTFSRAKISSSHQPRNYHDDD